MLSVKNGKSCRVASIFCRENECTKHPLPEGHLSLISSAGRARDCRAGTFPHNHWGARESWHGGSVPVNCYIVIRFRDGSESESLVVISRHCKLIRRGKFRAHAERGLRILPARLFECLLLSKALLVMVRGPAWFNARKVRHQTTVQYGTPLPSHRPLGGSTWEN